MKIGLLPLARDTFDVAFAEEKLAGILADLDATGHEIYGARTLLFDAEATKAALAQLGQVDRLLILQVTFTDAAMTVEAADATAAPLALWAVREPRRGGRLRLNALCGLNLASHALGRSGRDFGWLYADPGPQTRPMLEALLKGERPSGRVEPSARPAPTPQGREIATRIAGKRIARIGAHPPGFDTCTYDADRLQDLAGVTVDALDLDHLFNTARHADAAKPRRLASETLPDLDRLDQDELDRSLRLKSALDTIRESRDYDAFAIRCWPETFTEYGGAVCGPAGMMGEARVPCACEADVYGALTQLVLQEAAQGPVFLADLVDVDVDDNTAVVWHCGQAPASMRDPGATPHATIHTNRRMPLLYEFPLKPGPVTWMRISQARGATKMILGRGEMLKRPMAYTGTSGVMRMDRSAEAFLADVIASGLEHHIALAYGDHREVLRGVAGAMNLPLLEL